MPELYEGPKVNPHEKKLWRKHQENEYTRISKHNEGLCVICFKKTFVVPVVIKACKVCLMKRGKEAYLAVFGHNIYGFCLGCGQWKFDVYNLNGRVCQKCNNAIALVNEKLQKGEQSKQDPFWKRIKRRFGKDYEILWHGFGEQVITKV